MQPFCSNTAAPAGDVADTDAGSSGSVSTGDHGAAFPSPTSTATLTPNIATTPIAHGRRRGLRSPSGAINGSSRNTRPTTSGKPTMNTSSIFGGISAKRAKYHRKYQSGRGYAMTTVGSAIF